MKIMEKDGSMINVFGIYWQNNETYFSGFDKSYEGLTYFSLNEVEIIDSKMNFKTVFLTNFRFKNLKFDFFAFLCCCLSLKTILVLFYLFYYFLFYEHLHW